MAPTRHDAAELLSVIEGAPAALRAALQSASSFTDDEAALVRAALGSAVGPIADLAVRLLDRWDALPATERVSGLLLLAQYLAALLEVTDGP